MAVNPQKEAYIHRFQIADYLHEHRLSMDHLIVKELQLQGEFFTDHDKIDLCWHSGKSTRLRLSEVPKHVIRCKDRGIERIHWAFYVVDPANVEPLTEREETRVSLTAHVNLGWIELRISGALEPFIGRYPHARRLQSIRLGPDNGT